VCDIRINVLLQTNALVGPLYIGCTIYFLRSILKFTLKLILKLLLHVSVQQPSSGSILLILAKVIIIKAIG
jgi:hypothetical protein